MNFTHPYYPRDNTFYKGMGGSRSSAMPANLVLAKPKTNADLYARLMGKSIAGDALATGSYNGSVQQMASIAPGENLLKEIKKTQATLLG